ncbi:amidohydrolase family protein [Acuticoccus sp. M5D2P5]|uniref:amidohydrolase family protein n=1 Tax=Acuticoccus kalidii TaxID=2910977 RepID=UPI001F3DFA5F|nr:amidohydrolase family protein [Acuticoccus kalidii]MCF3931907.1 amidohydrolase family protein [Acuticoccus kalidii]
MIDHPIVDAHVHLADPARFTYPWMDAAPSLKRPVLPADFSVAAAPYVIDRFVFVEVDVASPQQRAEAEWVASLAKADPRLQGIVAAAEIEKGAAVADDLDALAAIAGVKGVRRLIQNQPDPDFCLKPGFREGLALLAARDLSFDICVLHHQLGAVIEMVRRAPNVRFVLDHIGKPGIKAGLKEPWWSEIETLAGFDNVWCKISGVVTEADHQAWTREEVRPFIERTIECFGFDRVMYGGDWHVVELATPYPNWVELVDWVVEDASRHERKRLFRDNAIAFYRLDG